MADHFQEKWSHPVAWTQHGHYLSQRPSFTFDPLFHAGCYYVQEASSMFLEQALRQSLDLSAPLKVLDLCAAPGGKSTHLQSLISDKSLLVSNDVIRPRANILKENMIKWGGNNVVVTNNDPRDFKALPGYFDVIVVDAPCSGSGLFRKDEAAINEWSDDNVALCSQRQQRILADVLPALKRDGILIYATCSFSKAEDEAMMDWLADAFALSNIRLATDDRWGITETSTSAGNFGYRFWPYLVEGEGFFLSAFRKVQEAPAKKSKRGTAKLVTKVFASAIADFVAVEDVELIQANDKLYAWPSCLLPDFDVVLQHLRVIYSGILLGEMAHKKFIPDHALAMSNAFSNHVKKVELTLQQSITYLQKNPLSITVSDKGWQLACYKKMPLGWINVLPNRINNYYPKELRILKQNFNV